MSFPASPSRTHLPGDYNEVLAEIKRRIQHERLRVVVSANSALVLLYWDIGRMIRSQVWKKPQPSMRAASS